MSYIHTLLFGIYPYIALSVLIVGSIMRYDNAQHTWKAGSSQFLGNDGIGPGSLLFHLGIIFSFFGHLAGMLTPASFYHHIVSPEMKQTFAITSGGVFGILCLIGLIILMLRRFKNPRIAATGEKSDKYLLLLLCLQILLGLLSIVVSAKHPDGSMMMQLAAWSQAVVTFRPFTAVEAVEGVHIIYKMHIFLGLTIFLMFPFTRLVHILSVPVGYLWRTYQVVREGESSPGIK